MTSSEETTDEKTPAELLRESAEREKRLLKDEATAERKLSRAWEKLETARERLEKARTRYERRAREAAEAEEALSRRQAERKAGAVLESPAVPESGADVNQS